MEKPIPVVQAPLVVRQRRVSANFGAVTALLSSGLLILFGMSVTATAIFAAVFVLATGIVAQRFPFKGEWLENPWRCFPFHVLAILGACGWIRAILGPTLSMGFILTFAISMPLAQAVMASARKKLQT